MFHAAGLDPKVSSYTEEIKQKMFNSNAAATTAILLYEFSSGTGDKSHQFNYNEHPFANAFFDGTVGERNLSTEILGLLSTEITKQEKAGNGNLLEHIINGESYSFGIPFSPDQFRFNFGEGIVKSIDKHVESNLAQSFIGGAIVTVTPLSIYLVNVTVENVTSRSSLELHAANDYTNQSIFRDLRTPLSNTRQTLRASIKTSKPIRNEADIDASEKIAKYKDCA